MTDEELAERIVKRFAIEGSSEAMRSLDPDYIARINMRGEILNSRVFMDALKNIIIDELRARPPTIPLS